MPLPIVAAVASAQLLPQLIHKAVIKVPEQDLVSASANESLDLVLGAVAWLSAFLNRP